MYRPKPIIVDDSELLGELVGETFEGYKKFILKNKQHLQLSTQDGKNCTHQILNSDLRNSEQYDLIKLAVDNGAPIDRPDNKGIRPLHYAAEKQNYQLVKYLLDNKADVNSKTKAGYTPIVYSISPEHQLCETEQTNKSQNKNIDEVYNCFINNMDTQNMTNMNKIYELINLYLKSKEEQYKREHLSRDEKITLKTTIYTDMLSELKHGFGFVSNTDDFKTKLEEQKKKTKLSMDGIILKFNNQLQKIEENVQKMDEALYETYTYMVNLDDINNLHFLFKNKYMIQQPHVIYTQIYSEMKNIKPQFLLDELKNSTENKYQLVNTNAQTILTIMYELILKIRIQLNLIQGRIQDINLKNIFYIQQSIAEISLYTYMYHTYSKIINQRIKQLMNIPEPELLQDFKFQLNDMIKSKPYKNFRDTGTINYLVDANSVGLLCEKYENIEFSVFIYKDIDKYKIFNEKKFPIGKTSVHNLTYPVIRIVGPKKKEDPQSVVYREVSGNTYAILHKAIKYDPTNPPNEYNMDATYKQIVSMQNTLNKIINKYNEINMYNYIKYMHDGKTTKFYYDKIKEIESEKIPDTLAEYDTYVNNSEIKENEILYKFFVKFTNEYKIIHKDDTNELHTNGYIATQSFFIDNKNFGDFGKFNIEMKSTRDIITNYGTYMYFLKLLILNSLIPLCAATTPITSELKVKYLNDIFNDTIKNIMSLFASHYVNETAIIMFEKRIITKPVEPINWDNKESVFDILVENIPKNKTKNMDVFKPFDTIEKNMYYMNDVFTTHTNKKKRCYVYDPMVTNLLIMAGAQLNNVNLLEMALLIQNEDAIKQLLGTPIKVYKTNIYTKYYTQFVDLFISSPINNIDDINKTLLKDLFKKTEKSNIFENTNLILPITRYLFIHQLTHFMDSYPNMWNINDQLNIQNSFNIDKDRQNIPLMKYNTDIDKNIDITTNRVLNDLEIKINKYIEIIQRLENSIFNLKIEKAMFDGHTYDRSRTQIIDKLITECEEYITKYKNAATKHNKSIRKIKRNPATKSHIKTRKNVDISDKTVCSIYDNFFKTIIHKKDTTIHRYFVYIGYWDNMLKANIPDATQVYDVISDTIIKNPVVEPHLFVNTYSSLYKLYDRVLLKYGKDLIELPSYLSDERHLYNDNYVLNDIYNIIIHVFKHILSMNFINMVSLFLLMYIKERSPHQALIMNIQQMISTSGFDTFCRDDMPKQIINSLCKIKPETKTVRDSLHEAINLLTLNTYDGVISDETQNDILTQLKEIICPYFEVYIELYVNAMYKLMVEQCSMLVQQGNHLKILMLLAKKATYEMNMN